MSIEQRVAQLERSVTPDGDGPIRIRVLRIPTEIPEEEHDAWVEAHTEAVSKVVDLPRGGEV